MQELITSDTMASKLYETYTRNASGYCTYMIDEEQYIDMVDGEGQSISTLRLVYSGSISTPYKIDSQLIPWDIKSNKLDNDEECPHVIIIMGDEYIG